MIRSHLKRDPVEMDLVKSPEHVEQVWSAISCSFDKYYDSWIREHSVMALEEKLKERFKVKESKPDPRSVLTRVLNEAVLEFEKAQEKYLKFFDRDALQEYVDDDPSIFKSNLARSCPVVHRCVHSKREVMREWQMRFRETSSQELLDIFINLVNFGEDYAEEWADLDRYDCLDSCEEFQFGPLQTEEEYSVVGVVGMGIQSEVMNFLFPAHFPKMGRRDLHALYFLSGMSHFGLPSETSEFLMINDLFEVTDHNYKMDHNYWYPYGVFALFVLRLFRILRSHCGRVKIRSDSRMKYVYIASFFDHVCRQNREAIDVMLGGYQD